ncbi:hypothetical protein ITJ61_12625 [Pseudoclavibacter sp. VKM Ac-2888]|nr:hypothetical protein [Pseudoclavibacter sp. VKM Ac-2888]PPF73464.1 hypothetical protein C5B99_16000 [Pseudoclavibacter sp. Z016]
MGMKPEQEAAPQQVAVWYFVAATFIFAGPALIADLPIWVRIASLVVGLVLVVFGGRQLGRETAARRRSRDAARPDTQDGSASEPIGPTSDR